MAWTTPPTFANPWALTDANTYIRDNLVSMRRCQKSMYQFANIYTLTTTATDWLTSGGIMVDGAPDEITTLQVIMAVKLSGSSGSTLANWIIKDQGGTVISTPNPTVVLNLNGASVISGTINVASGTNPGFVVRGSTDAGTGSWIVQGMAWVIPTTV